MKDVDLTPKYTASCTLMLKITSFSESEMKAIVYLNKALFKWRGKKGKTVYTKWVHKQVCMSYLYRYILLPAKQRFFQTSSCILHPVPQRRNSKVSILIWLLNCRPEGIWFKVVEMYSEIIMPLPSLVWNYWCFKGLLLPIL